MPTPLTLWRCDQCGITHHSEATAIACESDHAVRKVTDGFSSDLAAIMARSDGRRFMKRARERLGIPDPDDAGRLPPDGVPQF